MAGLDSFMDARCSFAMARTVANFEPDRAEHLAHEAIQFVAKLAVENDFAKIPWELNGEQALSDVFEQACQLRLQRKIAETKRAARLAEREANTPTSAALYAAIQSGNPIELGCQKIDYDDVYDGLIGTNEYGLDYFWGECTPESVSKWRTAVLNGTPLGVRPYQDSDLPFEDDPVFEIIDMAVAQFMIDHR